MISVTHLSRRFGAHLAVDDVTFRLERGEVVGFLGPNGAGKTTTMRMLTGFLPPSTGSVVIDGLDVLTQSLEVRSRIGYLPESVPLYREHRVEEMLVFQGRLHGLKRAEARRRTAVVLERVGLAERARSLIGRLSKGQRQRVGLAVALLPDPEVLILDEPTSGLDPLQRIEVRRLVQELASERTVLLSSHILPEIEAVCPRIILMNRGRIAADGTQEELVAGLEDEAHVLLEVRTGLAPEESLAVLRTLPGVEAVDGRGEEDGFERFELRSAVDLRDALSDLVRERGWRLRELARQRPTLERLFTRVALDLEGPRPRLEPAAGSPADDVSGGAA